MAKCSACGEDIVRVFVKEYCSRRCYSRVRLRLRAERLIAAGMCRHCGRNKPKAGLRCCEKCIAYACDRYAANRERLKAYGRQHYRSNRARIVAQTKARRDSRKDELREERRRLRLERPETVRRWKQADYQRNSDAYKARAIRHWYRKQYPGVGEGVIEMLVLCTEARRKMKSPRVPASAESSTP